MIILQADRMIVNVFYKVILTKSTLYWECEPDFKIKIEVEGMKITMYFVLNNDNSTPQYIIFNENDDNNLQHNWKNFKIMLSLQN